MSDGFDIVVIGAGVNGLTAAAYLAKAGKRVLVLEASQHIGGLCQRMDFGDGCLGPHVAQTLYALDPQVLKDFKSVRKGLLFAARDLPLVGLGEGGQQLVLSRDVHASARSIAAFSQADAEAWPRFRAELFGLARAMRKTWWKGEPFEAAKLSRAHQALLGTLQVTSAAAWLDGWFESDLLKATLAFDVSSSSLLEPSSALGLVWRAAQEMCGLQGAAAVPRRTTGALTRLLADAATAAGAVIRPGARVERLLVDPDGVAGVELGFRETVSCRQVLSTLSPRNTLIGLASEAVPFAQARAMDRADPTTGAALVALILSESPKFGDAPMTARFVVAERLESFIAADAAARTGLLPDELVFETIASSLLDTTVAPPGRHLVTCLVRPVPLAPKEGWQAMKPRLSAKIVAALDRLSPGLVPTIIGVETVAPDEAIDENMAAGAERLLSGWGERMRTPIPGLLLCGASAEPVAAASGRAGRIAAAMVLERP